MEEHSKASLIVRYSIGQTNEKESRLVESWLHSSKDDKSNYELVQELNNLDDDISYYNSIDVDKGVCSLRKKIKRDSYWEKIKVMKIVRLAAMLAVPLLISAIVMLYMLLNCEQEQVLYTEVRSVSGVITSIQLPDHSVVRLNSNSSLRYPTKFTGGSRDVVLDGEAFFSVTSSKDNPFIVHTRSGIKVMAHGTRFNVNAYYTDNDITAVLETGRIDVFHHNCNIISMKPGQCFTYSKRSHSYTLDEVNVDEYTAWQNGKIIFKGASFDKVLNTLSRRYNVDIVIHNSNRIAPHIYAVFNDETLFQVFEYLSEAVSFKWKYTGGKQNADNSFKRRKIELWIK